MRGAGGGVFRLLPLAGEAHGGARPMNPQYVLCGVIAAGILIYLAVALLKPELFS